MDRIKAKKTDYLFIKTGVKFPDGTTHHVFCKDKDKRFKGLYYVVDDKCSEYRLNTNNFNIQYITEAQYIACEKAYRQKFHAECVVSDYDDNIISFEDAVKLAPKLTKERYDECLELAKKELCDVYQEAINQTE